MIVETPFDCVGVRGFLLTQQKKITMTDTYNNERLKRIKEANINIIKGNTSIKMWNHPLRT
jgi:hypothetical protein